MSVVSSMAANDIPTRQNSDQDLALLEAASQVYGDAKRLAGWEVTLAVLAPVVLTGLAIFGIPGATWTSLYALVAILSQPFFDRYIQKKRQLGAQIQEQFDCSLFELRWHHFHCGHKPDAEDVIRATHQYRRHGKTARLRDWYPPAVGALPLPLARLVCQRANCRWDQALRSRYASGLLGVIGLGVVGLLSWGLADGWSAKHLVETAVILSPAILWAIQEYIRQREAVVVDARVKDQATALWTRVLRNELNESDLVAATRELQDAIFERRKNDPLVFNWIHRLTRPGNEAEMRGGADELVREWLSRSDT